MDQSVCSSSHRCAQTACLLIEIRDKALVGQITSECIYLTFLEIYLLFIRQHSKDRVSENGYILYSRIPVEGSVKDLFSCRRPDADICGFNLK